MTDSTIQKLTAEEYHELVDCIQQGCRIELDEYLEDHSPDNLTTLGQVLLEFFEFHQERMKEHAKMHEALRLIAERDNTKDAHMLTAHAQGVLKQMPPITIGSRVVHRGVPGKGTLIGIEESKPVVRWDRNQGSGTPVTGRMASWDFIQKVPER
jgi:hypothetical protein